MQCRKWIHDWTRTLVDSIPCLGTDAAFRDGYVSGRNLQPDEPPTNLHGDDRDAWLAGWLHGSWWAH